MFNRSNVVPSKTSGYITHNSIYLYYGKLYGYNKIFIRFYPENYVYLESSFLTIELIPR